MTRQQRAKRRRQQRQRRTAAIVIVLLALVCVAAILLFPHSAGENTVQGPDSEQSGADTDSGETSDPGVSTDTDTAADPDGSDTSQTPPVSTSEFDPEDWRLVLANYDHKLPDDWTVDVEKVQNKYEMDVRCAESMRQMIADAKSEGISLLLCSAYRDITTQERLYKNKVQEYLDRGYSQADAEAVAGTIVAVPGTSEHHTGLAADIVTPSYQNLNEGYAKTDAAVWLKQNAYKYGFVLRYPEDKQEITRIMFEPWHYRYVGPEAAKIIWENGYCLEEFLEIYCN